jgi:hypothetical protein
MFSFCFPILLRNQPKQLASAKRVEDSQSSKKDSGLVLQPE